MIDSTEDPYLLHKVIHELTELKHLMYTFFIYQIENMILAGIKKITNFTIKSIFIKSIFTNLLTYLLTYLLITFLFSFLFLALLARQKR